MLNLCRACLPDIGDNADQLLFGADHTAFDGHRLAFALQSPELFARYGIRPPRGVLLHGPPGCGKTALARAAAAAAGATLFVLNGSDVTSEAAGDSEAGLRGVVLHLSGLASL